MAILKTKLHFNIEQLLKMEGLLHLYVTGLDHEVLFANDLLTHIIEDALGINKRDLFKSSIEEIFKGNNDTVKMIVKENESVLTMEKPQQFYNVWVMKGICKIDLFTTKWPVYTANGKIYGVMGISQYIHRFSFAKALALGLSVRETECLELVLENKTYKQIANHLHLSVRTVEHYIDNVKNKLNCQTKLDLIFKFLQSDFNENLMDDKLFRDNKSIITPR